jgi:tetratricopeptide (TPR) repeat protein
VRRVLAEQKWKDRHKAAQQLLSWIEGRRQSGEAAVYVELIPGNRLVAERRWEEARRAYEPVRQKRPDDWQVRYRLAYLDFARGDDARAEAGFSQIVNSNPGRMPNWLKANAMLHLARVYDLRGQRDQAVKLYKKIVDDYENEGAAQNARRGLITAYRRPAVTAASGR